MLSKRVINVVVSQQNRLLMSNSGSISARANYTSMTSPSTTPSSYLFHTTTTTKYNRQTEQLFNSRLLSFNNNVLVYSSSLLINCNNIRYFSSKSNNSGTKNKDEVEEKEQEEELKENQEGEEGETKDKSKGEEADENEDDDQVHFDEASAQKRLRIKKLLEEKMLRANEASKRHIKEMNGEEQTTTDTTTSTASSTTTTATTKEGEQLSEEEVEKEIEEEQRQQQEEQKEKQEKESKKQGEEEKEIPLDEQFEKLGETKAIYTVFGFGFLALLGTAIANLPIFQNDAISPMLQFDHALLMQDIFRDHHALFENCKDFDKLVQLRNTYINDKFIRVEVQKDTVSFTIPILQKSTNSLIGTYNIDCIREGPNFVVANLFIDVVNGTHFNVDHENIQYDITSPKYTLSILEMNSEQIKKQKEMYEQQHK